MKFSLGMIAACMFFMLFWYGYTYSLTADAFMIQGWIGAAIPCVIAGWLMGLGWLLRDMERN